MYLQRLCLLLPSGTLDADGYTPAQRFSKSLKMLRIYSRAQSPHGLK